MIASLASLELEPPSTVAALPSVVAALEAKKAHFAALPRPPTVRQVVLGWIYIYQPRSACVCTVAISSSDRIPLFRWWVGGLCANCSAASEKPPPLLPLPLPLPLRLPLRPTY